MDNLLEHTQIKEFFPAYERLLFDKWKNENDPIAREELHRLMTSMRAFEIHLRTFILDGKLTQLKEVSNG